METELQAAINMDMQNSKYTLKDNKLRLNALELGLDGSVAMPGEAIKTDLFYEVQQSDFKNFISLLPNIYTESFEDVQTKGKLSLNGYVKGKYIDDHYPSFSLEMKVENGMFQYPDLPSSVNNVAMKTSIKHPGGKLDEMTINMKRLYMELGGAPVEMSMNLTDPMSDPYIDAKAKGKLDLANVDKYYPLEKGQKLQGKLDANLAVKARMSNVEQERYSRVDASGNLSLTGFNYKSPDLPNPVAIKTMQMSFNPRSVTLSEFKATIGESDLKMNGSIDNALGYALKGDMLKGSFSLRSNTFNTNQFMTESEREASSSKEESPDTGSYSVYEVPANLDFVVNGKFGKIIYGDTKLRNVNGAIIIRDETLKLRNLRALVLDGQINMDASYSTKKSKTNPAISVNYDIRKLAIQKSFKKFNTVKKLAPIARFFHGKFNSNMRLNGQMTGNMGLKMKTINGRGQVGIPNAEIRNFPALTKIADKLNYNQAKELKVRDVNASLRIKNGRVHLEPVTVQQNNITTTVEGSHGLDQTLDYTAGTVIPRDELGAANDAVQNLVASANIPGLQNAMPDNLAFDIGINGPMNDPNISVSLNKSAMQSSTKDMVQEQVDQAKEQAEKKAREAAEKAKDKAKEEAQKAADKAKDKAKEEAQKAADEAEDEAQKEAEKAADKAGDKAKDEAKDNAEDAADDAEDKVKDVFDP
ncbi:MAG: hypothetical protein BRD50_00190 [Bacteroidetes bacterium SW_11_45_7]|nr:MAG: hypothetical protein BRD50_00190 [Bacteroidetes bacterium SW_11_45_7]